MSHAIGFCCTLESGLNDRSERTIDEWLIVPRGEGSINSVEKIGSLEIIKVLRSHCV